jgi:transposase
VSKAEGIPQGRYTKELLEEAVKLVTEEKLSIPEAVRRLYLAPSTLGNWVKAFKTGKLGDIGKTQRPLTETAMELARIRKELAEVKIERDILKKAAAYFARESLPLLTSEPAPRGNFGSLI